MPPVIFRRLGYIGAAKQAAQGTAVAPSKFFKFQRHGFVPAQEVGHYRDGSMRDVTIALKQTFRYAGTFQTFLYADEGAALLTWAMGQDTVSGTVDPYTHAITLQDNLPYITVETAFYQDGGGGYGIIDRVADCKIGRLELDAEAARPVLLTVDLVGLSPSVQTTPATVTYADTPGNGPMMFYHGQFTITGPSDAATLAGQVSRLRLRLDNALEPYYANQLVPIAILEKTRDVELEFEAAFSGPSVYQLTYYGSNTGTGPAAALGTGSLTAVFTSQASPERSVTISLPNIVYEVAGLEIAPDADVARVRVVARPLRQGATMPVSVTVKNGVATAY